jgi:invasion protein IalB
MMTDWIKPLSLALLLAVAAPVAAQEQATEEDTGETPNPLALSMGEEGEPAEGEVYVAETHDDWEIRCIRTDQIANPCQLYQLLQDAQGNPVSEANIFLLGEEAGEATAGATIITPLETLLSENLTLRVDDGTPRRYPFSWCSQLGCVARLGFTDADIDVFKAGGAAFVSIVPVAAPDQRVTLEMSLVGFTAAYDALVARQEEAAADN